ncbi:hypothetical protein CGCA056_v004378 [Colletotrichum aenigma]|uniref:uncharacterized protein n=1 Tax=Colletotrichum aenigma TaxID=1215731 RepID=UPI0018731E49|nr:uncharacterized protein CGCA056_v004378 [Colletotrichum aenigma]KAF5524008.1 hypothetical protein CGCA056_v004378 [Colletotrichum aenigma]
MGYSFFPQAEASVQPTPKVTFAKSPKATFKSQIDETKDYSNSYLHRLQYGLGQYGMIIIGGGTTLILGILGFLLFLWSGEGFEDGRTASIAWRRIMLDQYIPQAITLSTVLLRSAVTAQSTIYTSLVAGIVLERHGVPLYRVAEISMIRCANDGPLRLAWLLVSSARKSVLQAALVIILLLTSLAVQFSSTLLVSDLGLASLVGDARDSTLRLHMSQEVISLNRQTNDWILRPRAYVPFGEVSSSGNSTPNNLGVSDTGVLNRVFLPVSSERMSSLRLYEGKGYGFDSRFVCMRPSVSAALSMTVPPSSTSLLSFYLALVGNISIQATFREAGLQLPPGCEDGTCFPSSFNCSLPQFQYTEAQVKQGLTNGLCLPDGSNARASAQNFTISGEPVTAWSEAFLFFRTNGTHDLWRSSDGRFLSVNLALPNVSYTDGEWITYERPIAELTPEGRRINKGVLRLDMTICFQQVAINFADVKVLSEKDLTEPKVTWDADGKVWDTRKVQRQLGIGPRSNTTTRRGIYSVDFIQNRQYLNATQYLTNKLINDLYNSPRDNISIFMDPLGSGISHVKPNVEYQAIFSDILNATNRPGVAMQSTLTALSGSIINDALPQFDVKGNALLTSSLNVLTPQSFRGLMVVFGVVALNMAVGLAVILVFMVQCRYSSQGNYWQGIAQIVSDETAWVLEGATQSSDSHVESQLSDQDAHVRVVRSSRSGRVRAVTVESIS